MRRMLAAGLVEALRAEAATCAVAESLTGGALTAQLVEVPGASLYLRGGVVTYATDTKASVLGVDRGLLETCGPVHPAVAMQMASGAARMFGADVGIATTGVAGPGPADGQPPGTVYVACAAGGVVRVRRLQIAGVRSAIRAATVRAALALAVGTLAGTPASRRAFS